MLEEVEYYLNEVLYNQIKNFKIEEKYINEIIQSIRIRMYSMIKNWNDIKLRKALLLVTEEEGTFYEPNASKDIKCFVVATIRNSKIETIGSSNCKAMGLDKYISDRDIKDITQNAIKYFKKQRLEELSVKIQKYDIDDFYGDIIKKYPMSWNAIMELANTKSKEVEFRGLEEKVKLNIEVTKGEIQTSEVNSEAIVEDGISSKYNEKLIEIMNAIENGKLNLFFTDSFKLVTRNFEKLLKTIEFVLQNDKIFITCNYMISNGYVAKRLDLLKATHTGLDTPNKAKITKGLPKTYANILNSIANQI